MPAKQSKSSKERPLSAGSKGGSMGERSRQVDPSMQNSVDEQQVHGDP